ncbi:hypothetical protein Ancab_024129 [Ancistrocladus abbreviatus]
MHLQTGPSVSGREHEALRRDGVLLLRGLDSRLSKDLPSDLQKVRCKVAFQALKFAPRILELGNKIAETQATLFGAVSLGVVYGNIALRVLPGHNINVFRIMPGHQGSSSASDVGNSYVHLYRLQRGLTNAVILIQDISFSEDSHWIMISSSRGTNHLFAISPSGGPVNLQFADPSSKNSGLRDYSSPTLQ